MDSDAFSSLHPDAVSAPSGETDTADCRNPGGCVVADELSTLESIDTIQPSEEERMSDGTHAGPLDNASGVSTIAVDSDGHNLCDTAFIQESLSDQAKTYSASSDEQDEPCLSSCEPTESHALGLKKAGQTVQQNQIVQPGSQKATICTSLEPIVILGQSLKASEMSDSCLASSPVYFESPEVASCNPEVASCNPEVASCNPEVASCNPEVASCNPGVASCNQEPAWELGQPDAVLPTATTDEFAELAIAELPEPAETVVNCHVEPLFPLAQCMEAPPVSAVLEPTADTTTTIPLTTSDDNLDKLGEPILLITKPFSLALVMPSESKREAEVPDTQQLLPSEAESCSPTEPVASSVLLPEAPAVSAPSGAVEAAPIETLQAATANIQKLVPDIVQPMEGTTLPDTIETAEPAEAEQPTPSYAGNDRPEPPVSLLVQSQSASSIATAVVLAQAGAPELPVPSEIAPHKFPELPGDILNLTEPTEELVQYPEARLELVISSSVEPAVTVNADVPKPTDEANYNNPEPIYSAEVPAVLGLLATKDVETVMQTTLSEKPEQDTDTGMCELPSIVELTPESELPALSEHQVMAVSSSYQLTAMLEPLEAAPGPVATKAMISQQSNRSVLLPDLFKPAVGLPRVAEDTVLITSGPSILSSSHPELPTDAKPEEKSERAVLSNHHAPSEEPFRALPKPEVRLGAQPFSSGHAGSSTSFRKVTFNPAQRLVSPPVTPTAQEHKYAFPGGTPPSALSQASSITNQPSSATSKHGVTIVSCAPQDEVASLQQHDTCTTVVLSPPIDIPAATKSIEQQMPMEKATDLHGIEDERQAIKKALQVRKKLINTWQHVSENSQADHVDGRTFTRKPSVTLLVQQSDGMVNSGTDVTVESKNSIPAKVPLVPPKSISEARVGSHGCAEAGMSGRFERPVIPVSQRFNIKEK